MTPKISVIIPVYNISKYLDKCLWSVTSQTFQDIEIIVVNDGSTDNSLEIINQYAQKDNRIKVVTKKNEGLAYARKTGLEHATADYIHHLDGDDYIELNCYELLYKKAIDTDADIAIMKFWFEDIDNQQQSESNGYKKEVLNNIDFLKHIWSTNNYFCVWQYLHKRSLYKNNIVFDKNISVGEDAYLTTQLAYYSKKIIVLNTPLHHYLIRSTSLTNTKASEKKINDIKLYTQSIINFMKSKPEYEDVNVYMLSLEVQSCGMILMARCFKDGHKNCKEAYKIVKQHPEIFKMSTTRPYKKLIKLYAISTILGRLFAAYYIAKGKIK